MSLKDAVHFRYLLSQLTSQESHQFMLQFIEKQANLLVSALFNHFTIDNRMASCVNDNISDIIRERIKNNSSASIADLLESKSNMQAVKLCDIPSSIISFISSFMKQGDFGRFSNVNRSVFLGCRSPNALIKICISSRNYQSFNCDLYPNVRRLHLELFPMNNQSFTKQSFFNQLEAISLDASGCSRMDLQYFTHQLPICVRVNRVQCLCFNDRMCSAHSLDLILSKFPNTKYLSLSRCISVDGKRLKSLLPSLKGLSIDCNNTNLIHSYGEQLEYLRFEGFPPNVRNIPTFYNINFQNLQQLKLYAACVHHICDISRTAINLKQLHLTPTPMDYSLSGKAMMGAMKGVITKCRRLEYIRISGLNCRVMELLKGITNGLMLTKDLKRSNIKIEINDALHSLEINDAVSDVIEQLQLCDIAHFMLIWKTDQWKMDEANSCILDQISQRLESKLDENVEIKVLRHLEPRNYSQWHVSIVVMNKACNINGYSCLWSM